MRNRQQNVAFVQDQTAIRHDETAVTLHHHHQRAFGKTLTKISTAPIKKIFSGVNVISMSIFGVRRHFYAATDEMIKKVFQRHEPRHPRK